MPTLSTADRCRYGEEQPQSLERRFEIYGSALALVDEATAQLEKHAETRVARPK
jgi:hypothetical protein